LLTQGSIEQDGGRRRIFWAEVRGARGEEIGRGEITPTPKAISDPVRLVRSACPNPKFLIVKNYAFHGLTRLVIYGATKTRSS
jgi:hypothetical protein